MKQSKNEFYFPAVIFLLSVLLWFLPTGFEQKHSTQKNVRAQVLSTDDSDLERQGLLLTGTQQLQVEILSGAFRGDTISTKNFMNGQLTFDQYYEPGHVILLILQSDEEKHVIHRAVPYSLYRTHWEFLLFLIFAVFLLWFSRWTGAKALLSFVFTALMIWKVLIPAFLKGWNPLFISLFFTFLCTAVILFLIAGFSRKGVTAFSGACLGILITAIFSFIFGGMFQVPGTVRDFAEMILYAGFLKLSMTQIFLSGIFISAAGAVMDVAMDVAASQEEMIRENPLLTSRQLMASGFRVARAVIGTMTTTLLFAYSGGFTFVLMMFMARGVDPAAILNTSFVAAEILQTLVGSFGLVLVAPLTAVAGGFIYTYSSGKESD